MSMPIEGHKKETGASAEKPQELHSERITMPLENGTSSPFSYEDVRNFKFLGPSGLTNIQRQKPTTTPPAYVHSIKSRIVPGNPENPISILTRTNGQLDPKKLFELVSKNYESWSQAMYKQFQEDDNFSPFPNEDDYNEPNGNVENGSDSQPIFNYSLLEALEKASTEFSDKISKLEDEIIPDSRDSDVVALPSEQQVAEPVIEPVPKSVTKQPNAKVKREVRKSVKNGQKKLINPSDSLLKESEIDTIRERLARLTPENFLQYTRFDDRKGGFTLYDTTDEEGLHEGNTDACYDEDGNFHNDQDDYDLQEINDDQYVYDYPPTHHIELELNTAPECDEHGMDGCDCPVYEYEDREQFAGEKFGDDGPSCEFTFEYDHTGKLVPTYSNVEEKMRLMGIQARFIKAMQAENGNGSKAGNGGQMKLPSINELDIGNHDLSTGSTKSKKKNKKKKKKKKNNNDTDEIQPSHESHQQQSQQPQKYNHPATPGSGCCLFCEYELIFGSKPRQMIKWYDQSIRRDEQRREEIKKKLENAKSKAMKRQREMRERQSHSQNEDVQQPLVGDQKHSNNGYIEEETLHGQHHEEELIPEIDENHLT